MNYECTKCKTHYTALTPGCLECGHPAAMVVPVPAYVQELSSQPVRTLAARIVAAVAADEQSDGCDLSAGLFGTCMSALVVELAQQEADLYAAQDQVAELQRMLEASDKALGDAQKAVPAAGKIPVSSEHLYTVLTALRGAPHQIRELQATTCLPDNPINALVDEFNEWGRKS